MVYIKIILLKIAIYIAVMIWNIIRFFRWNKNIDLKDIKKIIFNRKDRIWDAVISKPFIILFSKYVKEELWLNIEIEVECSKYNEFIFKEWNWEKYYRLKSEDTKILWYWKWIIELIKFFFKSIKNSFKLKRKNNKESSIVYIDLIWNHNHISDKLNKWIYYFIWPNLFFNNYLLDYSISNNYVSWNGDNLIESYMKLIEWCFKLDNFEDYINKNIEYFFQDYNYSKNKKWILVFVGNKEFRNLSIETRNKIITDLWKKYKEENISILDDNSNILYWKLIKYNNHPKNIVFIENKFSWNELKNFAKQFRLIIWIDWWWFNYIRTCTDSLEIFTLANSSVWSIFTWNNKYKKSDLWNNWIINKCAINWKIFWYIYKESIILPSYDYSVPKNLFNDLIVQNI